MNEIPLRDFIAATLIDVASGIKDANSALRDMESDPPVYCMRCNIGDDHQIPGVEFDVAVSTSDKKTEKAGFLVALANIGGGASDEKTKGSGNTHRIKFEVGVDRDWM